MSFDEWKKYKLGDIATFSYGKMPKKELLGTGQHPTFSGYRYQYKYPEINCKKDDLIIVARGVGGTGDVKLVREDCYLTNLSIKINLNKDIAINEFLFYNYFLDTLRYLDSGSAQSQITIDDLKRIEILLPKVSIQKKISAILSSIDDKIVLNRQTNQTLETIAQTLFNEMCLFKGDELPEGWKIGKLGDILTLQRGFDLPAITRTDGKYPVIAASGFNGYHNEFKNKNPGVTTGRSGVLGNVFYVQEDFWALNTSLFVKDFKIGHPIFSYFLLKKFDLKNYNGGSAVPTLNRNDVHKIEIAIPPLVNIHKFTSDAKDIFVLIHNNQQEIKTLISIRDGLLPKLMKGEVEL